MTDGKHKHHGCSGSEALPDCSKAPMENMTVSRRPSTSSVASHATAHPESHVVTEQLTTNVIHEQNELDPDLGSRLSLGSREMSTDLMDEIRKVIRQEFLGAYAPKDHHSENPANVDGSVSPTSTDIGNKSQDRRPSYSSTILKSTHDESDDMSCSPTKMPGGSSSRTSLVSISSPVSRPMLSMVHPAASKPDPLRPGVRFNDNVPLIRSPLSAPASTSARAKKAPWTMYRRASSSGGEPVPEWGVLFDENGFATVRCGQVFRGLARSLTEEFLPRCGLVITPEKLGLLYSRFRIEGEVYPFEDIFHSLPFQEGGIATSGSNSYRLTTYYNRIGDFFADLDCEYYLVPPSTFTFETSLLPSSPSTLSVASTMAESPSAPVFPRSSSFSSLHLNPDQTPQPYKPSLSSTRPRPRSARPCIPALTPVGFAQFLTTCVLAHPDEEAKRMERIVSELSVVADVPSNSNNLTAPSTPFAPNFPSQDASSASHTSGFNSTSDNRSCSEKLPRQFVRSLFPVKADANSRKLLAAAVEDLLCDLRLSSPSYQSNSDMPRPISASSSMIPASPSAIQLAEHNRRWSFASVPTNISLSSEGDKSTVPHLPPPPVPLPRSGSSVSVVLGPGTNNSKYASGQLPTPKPLLPSSSSAGCLAKLRADTPLPGDGSVGAVESELAVHRPHRHHHQGNHHHHYHQPKRYGLAEIGAQTHNTKQAPLPPAVLTPESSARKTRFELGEAVDEDDSAGSDTVTPLAVITARGDRRGGSRHDYEREKERAGEKDNNRQWGSHREGNRNNRDHDYDYDRDRDRERDKFHDRDRDRERERRPAPTPRRHSDRRRSSAAINSTIPAPNPSPNIDPRTITTPSSGSGSTTPHASHRAVGERNIGAVIVAQQHLDDRGPTWSEVIRAQQHKKQQATPIKGTMTSGVSYYDERDHAYDP